METTLLKSIICCGFTPCLQRIIEFDRLEKGAVNRASRVMVGVGGKGANTARLVKQLGGEPELIGFAGGNNGRLLEHLLSDEDVAFRHVEAEGETRICQTLVEKGNPEPTELVEEMPSISAEEWDRMLSLFASVDLTESIVTVSGKLPSGAPADAYAKIARLVTEQGGQVVLDAPGEPLLSALAHQPLVVKINDTELLQTVGGGDLPTACRDLLQRGARSVLITRGSRSALYMDEDRTLEIVPPRIEAVNPVGSGDAVMAGLAVELARGIRVEDALITGMACGAANALNLVSGMLNPADIERLRPLVRINPVEIR
jgi:tagatose 6-phosphate kinase